MSGTCRSSPTDSAPSTLSTVKPTAAAPTGTRHDGDVRRIVDDARAVFVRLDKDATRHLEQSWRGHAGGRALEALRR